MFDAKDFFQKKCTNQMLATTVRDGKLVPMLYRRGDLTQWAKEAYERGEPYFYCEPVNPDKPNGELQLCEPKYIYVLKQGLSEEEFLELTKPSLNEHKTINKILNKLGEINIDFIETIPDGSYLKGNVNLYVNAVETIKEIQPEEDIGCDCCNGKVLYYHEEGVEPEGNTLSIIDGKEIKVEINGHSMFCKAKYCINCGKKLCK